MSLQQQCRAGPRLFQHSHPGPRLPLPVASAVASQPLFSTGVLLHGSRRPSPRWLCLPVTLLASLSASPCGQAGMSFKTQIKSSLFCPVLHFVPPRSSPQPSGAPWFPMVGLCRSHPVPCANTASLRKSMLSQDGRPLHPSCCPPAAWNWVPQQLPEDEVRLPLGPGRFSEWMRSTEGG